MFYEQLKQTPEGVHPGIFRSIRIAAFNAQELNLDADIPPSPLSSIAYAQRELMPDYAREVADAMCLYPWQEVYGLDFNQTMQLPFDEWKILLSRLVKRPPNQSTTRLIESIDTLSKIMLGIPLTKTQGS